MNITVFMWIHVEREREREREKERERERERAGSRLCELTETYMFGAPSHDSLTHSHELPAHLDPDLGSRA